MLPLVELRADFDRIRAELRDTDRGADDVDLGALDDAAHQLAAAENVAVLHGWQGATAGIARPHRTSRWRSAQRRRYPRRGGRARSSGCCRAGWAGPYGLALGSEEYRLVIETAERGGYPLVEHLEEIVDGPIVWTPGVDGSDRAEPPRRRLLFESGQDISIGYESHDADVVRLYLEESFSFHVATPEAAVALTR